MFACGGEEKRQKIFNKKSVFEGTRKNRQTTRYKKEFVVALVAMEL